MPDDLRPELNIDTHKPLRFSTSMYKIPCQPSRSDQHPGSKYLIVDRLALRMVRSHASGPIVSLHPSRNHRDTTAEQLRLPGKSVYWCNSRRCRLIF